MVNESLEERLNREYVSISEAARRLDLSEPRVHQLIAQGKLEVIRVPLMRGARLVSVKSLDHLINEREEPVCA
jgi:excisionase family DNA binding protein